MTTRYVFVDPTDYKSDVDVADALMKKMSTSEKKSSDAKPKQTQVKKRDDPPANPCNFTPEFAATIPMINCGIDKGIIHSIVGKKGHAGAAGSAGGSIGPYKYYDDATAANNSILPTITDGNTTNDATHATIGNGKDNIVENSAKFSTISNGNNLKIEQDTEHCTINNGKLNTIMHDALLCTINNGNQCDINLRSTYCTINNGNTCKISSAIDNSTINNGLQCNINAGLCTINNGNQCDINGGAYRSTIINGENCTIQNLASGSTILNGNSCDIYGTNCMIYGGYRNKINLHGATRPLYTSIISGSNITTELSNTAVAQNLQNTGGRIESVTIATRALPTDTFFQLTADHHHVFNGDSNILSFRLPDRGNPTIAIGQIYELRSLLIGPGPATLPVSITLPSDVILKSVDNLSENGGGPGDVTFAYNFANLRILLRAQDSLHDFWVIINQI